MHYSQIQPKQLSPFSFLFCLSFFFLGGGRGILRLSGKFSFDCRVHLHNEFYTIAIFPSTISPFSPLSASL